LQIKVAVGGPFEINLLTHYICWWGPSWKNSTYTLQLLLGGPLKVSYLHITIAIGSLFESMEFNIIVAVGGLFESIVRTHYNCCC